MGGGSSLKHFISILDAIPFVISERDRETNRGGGTQLRVELSLSCSPQNIFMKSVIMRF